MNKVKNMYLFKMKLCSALIFALLWISIPTLISQNKLDSLTQSLSEDLTDDLRVSTLLQLHKMHIRTNPDSAEIYLEKVYTIAKASSSQTFFLDYLYSKGEGHYLQGELAEAIPDFEELIIKALEIQDSVRAYKASNFLCLILWKRGDLLKAIEQGLKCFDYEKDEGKHARLYNNLGGIFEEMDDDQKALEYYEKSLSLHRLSGNGLAISGTLGNIGVVYYNLKEFDKALGFLEESIEILRPFDQKMHLSIRLENIGNIYYKMGQYDVALEKFKEGLGLSEEINDDYGISSIASNIGKTLIEQVKYSEAKIFLDDAEEKARKINSLSLIVDALNIKGQLENARRNYKEAFDIQSEFVVLKDSLLNEQKFRAIQDMESKYQKVQQENKIQKQETLIEKGTAQRNLFILVAFAFTLLGGLVIFGLRQRMKKNKKIHAQEKFIQEQKIKDLEKEKKILSLAAMIEGQEAERTRIAKDLHDGLGGLLSTVKAHFNIIQSQVKKLENINVYDKTNDMIDNAVEEVRRISHNLMPGALRLEGLPSAIEEIADNLRSAHKLNVDLEISNMENRFDENREVFVYRVIQEAANNIIKHANAKSVLIQLSQFDNELNLIIEDDGKGFKLSEKNKFTGIGLKSMQSRVEHLDGTFDIDSKEGTGTTITINIPFE